MYSIIYLDDSKHTVLKIIPLSILSRFVEPQEHKKHKP